MAIQVINDPNRSLSASLGSAVGGGLADVLNILAQNKLNDIQERQIQRRGGSTIRNAFSNLSEGEANFLAQYPQYIPNVLSRLNKPAPTQVNAQNVPTQEQPITAPRVTPNIADLFQQPEQQRSALQQAAVRGLTPAQQEELAAQMQGQQPQSAFDQTLQRGIAQQLAQQSVPAQQQLAQQQQPQQQAPVVSAPTQPAQPTFEQLIAQGTPEQQRLDIARQREEALERRHIEKLYAKKLDKIEEEGRPAREAVYTINHAKELLKTGKVYTGITGHFTPNYLQSDEGQALVSDLNKLVTIQAQLGKGVPSRVRLQMEALGKPSVSNSPKAIQLILDRIENDPGLLEDASRSQALQEITEQNNGNIPRSIIADINKRSKQIIKAQKKSNKQPEQQNIFRGSPSSYPNGTRAIDDATGDTLITENGQWR